MKISIGIRIQDGPWGGGSQFGRALSEYLTDKRHAVFYDLSEKDLDIILLAAINPTLKSCAFTDSDIYHYIRKTKFPTLVVHRINECDQRKNTTGVNKTLRRANLIADHTIFVSEWLRDLHLLEGMTPYPNSIIYNGSDRSIFSSNGYVPWDHRTPLKLVTHHWGAHWLKGFDIYQRLDDMLGDPHYRDRFSFTYIGNVPPGFRFRHAIHKSPLHGHALASELRMHHVYLTASQFEPGGNHQNEGANCGLPLLYLQHASMPEYCNGYGIGYTFDNFNDKISEMLICYDYWLQRINEFPFNAEVMASKYLNIFESIISDRQTILNNRSRLRYLHWLLSSFTASVIDRPKLFSL